MTLGQVLNDAVSLSVNDRLFLPFDEVWTLSTRCAVAAGDEHVAPGLEYAMLVSQVCDAVANAKAQKPDASPDMLLRALLFYYDHDAFIEF
ncbi:MAG TPA: hypothetical protein VGI40_06120 [Pirellulaceae bacterium]|jgi:hypothetical protein